MKLVNTRKLLKEHNWDIDRSIMLMPELLYSEAFRSLSKVAMHMLFRFLQKRKFPKRQKGKRWKPLEYGDFDNSNLVFTYLEGAAFGIDETSFNRGRKELVRKGFIEQVKQGGAIGNKKDFSVFKYIEEWKWYGTSSFKTPEIRKANRTSNGFDKVNAERKAKKQANCKQSKTTVVPLTKSTVVPLTKQIVGGVQ